VNPTKFASTSNLLLIRDGNKRERSLMASESNPQMLVDGAVSITGQRKQKDPSADKNRSTFKYAYSKEELA